MKAQKSLSRPVSRVAAITLLLLAIPFTAMQFTKEVNWSASDFIIMGLLIFGTGLSYVFLTRYSSGFTHRAAFALAVGTTFLLIWVNLAVGLIGSGPNAANLMYAGIVAIVIIGTLLSRFTSKGMKHVMFIAAFALAICAGIQLLAKMYEYAGSSVTEIIMVNAFFAMLYAICGLLFRHIALKLPPAAA
ncbi:hypothetical protein [Parafilimonas terrae]|uniref:Uncharacterized protein n=1 Tax=Parafilimonas terrae TaxID=1465490 RepID=A0A1I5UIB4_9BACT|nr:hypothetical protein [Parafilimonas terrae]SFP95021.1 hypothetical protein SAMN05444277_103314 [Parafilimonas terrae]